MRSVLLTGILLLALSAAYAQPSAVQQEVEAIAAAHHGKVALFAENLKTHESVAIAPNDPVQTASVIKLAILYEALEQVRDGEVHFEDRLALNKADQVPGSGILQQLDTPLPLTLKDALTLMIEMSDNTATNLAIDHLGLTKINQRVARLGLRNTYLYKQVFVPIAPGVAMPADQKRFGLGKTTPREMAMLMEKLVACDLGGPARAGDSGLCDAALNMLRNQFYRDGIPRYLDILPGATNSSIANKTGSLNAVRNDVAAISSKNGMIVLSIFTYDNADQGWTPDDEGDMTIAKLARAIVQTWSPQGLAAWPGSVETSK